MYTYRIVGLHPQGLALWMDDRAAHHADELGVSWAEDRLEFQAFLPQDGFASVLVAGRELRRINDPDGFGSYGIFDANEVKAVVVTSCNGTVTTLIRQVDWRSEAVFTALVCADHPLPSFVQWWLSPHCNSDRGRAAARIECGGEASPADFESVESA